MTDIDLAPIKERLARARHLPIFLTEGDIAKAQENRKGLYRWHLEGTWDDAVLFGRARDDIAALVAEVERLQKENEELRKGYDLVKYGAATGPMIGLAINDAAQPRPREQVRGGKPVNTAEMINHELAARWEMCCEAVGIDTDATAAEWREAYEAKRALEGGEQG